MSFSRWQNESDRMIAKVVPSTEEPAETVLVCGAAAVPAGAAKVLSVINA